MSKSSESDDAIESLKDTFYNILDKYGRTQPKEVAELTSLLQLPIVQAIEYTPVTDYGYLELGTHLSLGLSRRIGNARIPWLRWQARLLIDGLPWVVEKGVSYQAIPAFGFIWEPQSLSGGFMQLREASTLAIAYL